MISDYVAELLETDDITAFEEWVRDSGLKVCSFNEGFFTYRPAGDAFLIYDAYVRPEYRRQKIATKVFSIIRALARKHSKRLIITMQNKKIKNRTSGQRLCEQLGFTSYLETPDAVYYIQGA